MFSCASALEIQFQNRDAQAQRGFFFQSLGPWHSILKLKVFWLFLIYRFFTYLNCKLEILKDFVVSLDLEISNLSDTMKWNPPILSTHKSTLFILLYVPQMNIFEICKEIVFENFISVYIEKMIVYTPILPLPPQHVPLFTLSPLFLFLLLSSSLFCHVVSPVSATHTCMIWNPSLKYGKASVGTQSMKNDSPFPISHQFPRTPQKRVGPGKHIRHLCQNFSWLDPMRVLCR